MAEISSVIGGKYEILKKIGQGGMSEVYLAMDQRLNKQWAVKEIKKVANSKTKEVIIQSLIAEANLMKKLDHTSLPRIVDIIDTGETIYVVMDYIEGEPLDRILRENGAQPQELVIEWAKVLCDVLQYLHSQKPPIIYRDMKPANIMLKPEGTLKVIDFGIAREYKEENIADTVSLGTRGYAAPEQFGGKGQTDARTDIYSLGVTLYHLVTGQNPCEPPYEMYPIRQWDSRLSGGFESIIQKCTQLNPNDRYQNCAELKYALEHYEEADGGYQKKQKKKLAIFVASAVMCLLTLGGGITSVVLAVDENNKNYDMKVSISEAGDYATKIKSYVEATELIPDDTRAYMCLLNTYKQEGRFGDEESGKFLSVYNKNKNLFDKGNTDFLNLNYEIGVIYFSLYSGGDNTTPTRIKRAREYFKIVEQYGNPSLDYYSKAKSYAILGDFYSTYINNSVGEEEPTAEVYRELINSFYVCIESVDEYNAGDAAFVKLTVYKEIFNLIHEHRSPLAKHAIDEENVLGLIKLINDKSQQLSDVTQPRSLKLIEYIEKHYAEYTDDVKNTYENSAPKTVQEEQTEGEN